MNRRTLMTFVAGASLMNAAPTLGQTPSIDDRAQVQAWLENCEASWATGDAERMFRMATEDVEWVNIVGMHWQGRAEVIATHAGYFATMFKGVPLTLRGIESLRRVGSDAVVAVVRWSIGQFSPPDGSIVPAADDRMTLVFQRMPEGLMLAHGANIQIDPVAAAFDPGKGPPAG